MKSQQNRIELVTRPDLPNSNNNSPMSVAASQASSVNVAAPDEDELAQSKKDYSFRLFENGQLVGSAAEGAATSAQNSLTTTTSGGGSSITTTPSDEPISSCISSPLSSLPPGMITKALM